MHVTYLAAVRNFGASFFTLLLLVIQNPVSAQERGTGLLFAPQNVLEGIPLAHTPFAGAEQPRQVDLSDKMPPPGQQGRQNSCVAWALAYALKSYHEYVEEKTPLKKNGTVNLDAVFSPAFVYNQINRGQDRGSFFVDALNILSQKGAVKWSEMPYDPVDYSKQPSASMFTHAKRYRIDIWRRVNIRDAKEVKAQLQMTIPVVIGAEVYENFVHHKGGVFRTPQGTAQGGHAMLVVGYNDEKAAFKVLNSWGTDWGDQGFGWIDYDCFTRIVREGYVALDAANGDGPLVRDLTPVNPNTPLPPPPVQPSPLQPTANVAVEIGGVQHNILHPAFGPCMLISGMVVIPPGHPGTAQVVVSLFQPGNNFWAVVVNPVRSALPAFATVQGQAAASPGLFHVTPNGYWGGWQVYLPYAAPNLPAGFQVGSPQPITHQLLLKATVYINNFGVGEGRLIPFTITK